MKRLPHAMLTDLGKETGGWRAVLSLDPGGVIFEVKLEPYTPFIEEDSAPWSPAADDETRHALMDWHRKADVGLRVSASG